MSVTTIYLVIFCDKYKKTLLKSQMKAFKSWPIWSPEDISEVEILVNIQMKDYFVLLGEESRCYVLSICYYTIKKSGLLVLNQPDNCGKKCSALHCSHMILPKEHVMKSKKPDWIRAASP